jgi:hypothetical protein
VPCAAAGSAGATVFARLLGTLSSSLSLSLSALDQDSSKWSELFQEQWEEAATGYGKYENRPLTIRCHCQGVDLKWYRGAYEGTPKEDLPWFIDPITLKPLASFCACNSCRISSGVEIFNWTFGELKFISFTIMEAPHDEFSFRSTWELKACVDAGDPSVGTLTYYASSKDVQRYFCSRCSACVFYAVDDRPEIVDIAIGVLHAPDDESVAGYLSWSFGEVGGKDDSQGGWRHDIITGVEEEAEEWRVRRGYPKSWRREAKEEAQKEVAASASRDEQSQGKSGSASGCGQTVVFPGKTEGCWMNESC